MRRTAIGLGAVVVAGIVGVFAGPFLLETLRDRGDGAAAPVEEQASVEDDQVVAQTGETRTVLLTTTAGVDDPDGGAVGVVVLGLDGSTGRGTILLVPTTLAAEVPGFGLLQLAGAEQVGGAPLVGLTLTNLLGLDVDASASLTQQDWAALFSRVGGYEVELRERLVVDDGDGGEEVRFEPGRQFLDGPRLAELLVLRQPGEPELSSLPRAQVVLAGLLDAAGADEGAGLAAIFEDGAPMVRADVPDAVEEVLRGLVAASAEDLVDVRTLPVSPIGAGDDASYRLDAAGAEALLADRFPSAGDDGGDAETTTGLRLEIRNGVGTPGLGASVTQRLVPLGHRVVLTGNADRFDVAVTRVIVYDDDPELVRAAQEIVEALGVGRVELSEAPQQITDATVLVGADFVP